MTRTTHTSRRGGTAAGLDPAASLLAATRAIFEAEGLAGLSVRRVADAAGCTTMLVYSRFGGKDGLVGAMFDQGFDTLAAAQQALGASRSAKAHVLALCSAYRRVAHEYPHHYALMLGPHSGGFSPSPDSRQRAQHTFDHLLQAVAATLPAGRRRGTRAREVAGRVLAFCHGWVTLERTQALGDAASDAAFTRGVQALLGAA
jgi:AcrR family transcriptional regulator